MTVFASTLLFSSQVWQQLPVAQNSGHGSAPIQLLGSVMPLRAGKEAELLLR